jgi:excisionase family DNA binding protein
MSTTVIEKLDALDEMLTVARLSKILGVPAPTIYLWVSENRIPVQRIHGCIRFNAGEIATWLAKQ